MEEVELSWGDEAEHLEYIVLGLTSISLARFPAPAPRTGESIAQQGGKSQNPTRIHVVSCTLQARKEMARTVPQMKLPTSQAGNNIGTFSFIQTSSLTKMRLMTYSAVQKSDSFQILVGPVFPLHSDAIFA